jgi:hypothetical protein
MNVEELTAPQCPYCKLTTVRRRRFWQQFTIVRCKTPGCFAEGEMHGRRHDSWMWSRFIATRQSTGQKVGGLG